MDVYVYAADLYCEDCASKIMNSRHDKLLPHELEDSDHYPQGPYREGGGEAGCPWHCRRCGIFLENPLIGEGEDYVCNAIADGEGNPDVLAEWAKFYGIDREDVLAEREYRKTVLKPILDSLRYGHRPRD